MAERIEVIVDGQAFGLVAAAEEGKKAIKGLGSQAKESERDVNSLQRELRATGLMRETAEVKVDVDRSQLDRLLAQFGKGGGGVGTSLAVGPLRGVPFPGLSIPVLLPLLTDLVGALGAVAGSAAEAGAGLAALGASGVGALTIGLAGVASIAVPAIASLKDLTTAQDNYNKAVATYGPASTQAKTALLQLTAAQKIAGPAASAFAGRLLDLKNRWLELTQVGRTQFFGMLNDAVGRLSTLLPQLAQSANRSMAAFREGFDVFLKGMTGPDFQRFLDVMTRTWAQAAPTIGDAMANIGRILMRIAVAAAPDLIRMIDRFDAWTVGLLNSTRNARDLRESVHGLVDQFNSWWDLLKAAGNLMLAIFGAGANQGQRLVDGLTRKLKEWTGWINTHQREVHDFFRRAAETTRNLASLLAGLVPQLMVMSDAMRPIASAFLAITKALNSIKIGNVSALTALLGAFIAARGALAVRGALEGLGLLGGAAAAGGAAGAAEGAVGGAVTGAAGGAAARRIAGGFAVRGSGLIVPEALAGGEAAAGGSIAAGLSAVALPLGAILVAMKGIDETGLLDAGGPVSKTPLGTVLGIDEHNKGQVLALETSVVQLKDSIGKLGNAAPKDLAQLRDALKETQKAGGDMGDELTKVSGVISSRWHDDLARMRADSFQSMGEIKGNLKQALGDIEQLWGDHGRVVDKKTAQAYGAAIDSIKTAMKQGTVSVKEGTAEIDALVVKQLHVFGVSTAGMGLNQRKIDIQSGFHGGHQTGGMVVPGSGSGDSVPVRAMVEPGEGLFVLNRNAMGALQSLNEKFPRFAKGGAVFPLAGQYSWGRTDMGVDFAGSAAIRAITDAVILATGAPGWPGGGGVLYQMLAGSPPVSPSSRYIYNYENVAASVRPGQRVRAGQTIGRLLPGFPNMEIGFATSSGAALAAHHYSEGDVTAEGSAMRKWLQALGGGGGGLIAQQIARVILTGPDSPLKAMAQGALDRERRAANAFIARQSAENIPTGAMPSIAGSGNFLSTAYGPPWGGIQGTGTTATGIDLSAGPKRYLVAVDPSVIPLHSKLRIQPNPFGYSGPFAAEDTGGAILGHRIDFYDWLGRADQLAWGARNVNVQRFQRGGAITHAQHLLARRGEHGEHLEHRIQHLGRLLGRDPHGEELDDLRHRLHHVRRRQHRFARGATAADQLRAAVHEGLAVRRQRTQLTGALEPVVSDFLEGLGIPFVGAFAHGGPVGRSGIGLLHQGETVGPDPNGPFGSTVSAPSSGSGGPTEIRLTVAEDPRQMVRVIDARVDGKKTEIVREVDRRIGREQRVLEMAPGGGG